MRIIFVFLILTYKLAHCEVFSSTDELVDLTDNQEDLLEGLKQLVVDLENNVEVIKKQIKSISRNYYQMKVDPQKYVSNPLNAFILIKSLTYDIETIDSNIMSSLYKFNEATEIAKLENVDFEGALSGFYRLQQIYDLKSEDLAAGIVDGEKIREELTSDELYTIGSELMEVDREKADEYLKLALDKSPNSTIILQSMLENQIKAEWLKKAVETVHKMMKIDPENLALIDIKLNHTNLYDKPPPNREYELQGTHYTPLKAQKIFSQSCRGLRTQSINLTSKLFCKFHTTNFFTKIAPFKIEVMNLEPFVAIFHEIISDNEIQELKDFSKWAMNRASTKKGNGTVVTDVRVAKVRWAGDKENEVVARISKRVSDMSGLSLDSAEFLQVQNYGIGGHYDFHHDYYEKDMELWMGKGNRVATTLFYMSDVIKGGATVFPFLRLYLPPKKGTAAFWHNLSSSGDRETLTLHAACPVLVGSKWVANKWLHEYGQETYRPCELQPRQPEQDHSSKFYTLL